MSQYPTGRSPHREHLNEENRMAYATSPLAARKLAAHIAPPISPYVADTVVVAVVVLGVR
jgi:hypothetical protein